MRTCESNGASLAVIYQNRFLPEVARMKELLEGDAIGPVFLADASVKWFRDQAYYDGAMWRGTRKFDGGGVLINQAIHTIDLLQWFLGETELAFGCTSTRTHYRLEGEDNAVATLRFESGTLAVIEASTSVVPAQERKISLYGERGTLELDGNTLRHKSDDRTETTSMTGSGGAADPMQNVSAELHRRQFEAIFEALRAGEQPPVSGEESLRSLAIVEGIYRSAKTGMPTKICDLL